MDVAPTEDRPGNDARQDEVNDGLEDLGASLTPAEVPAEAAALPQEEQPVYLAAGRDGERQGVSRWVVAVIAAAAVVIGVGATAAIMSASGGEEDTVVTESANSAPSESAVATQPSSAPTATTEPSTVTSSVAAAVPEQSTTTVVEPALPIGLEDSLRGVEPYRYSFPDGMVPPELPTAIEGFVIYDGADSAGVSGSVRSATLRVFDGTEALVPLPELSTQMNGCGDAFWVARWVVKNPDVRIVATNELDPIVGVNGVVEDEPWLLPPEAPTGIMGGSICTAPGFQFSSTVNGNGANLVDVVVEWTYFDRDPFAASGGSAAPASATCDGYFYDEFLPLELCSEGPAVMAVQEVLGLAADGFYGSGTQQAVRQFQQESGIPVTGSVDRLTWATMGPDYLMYLD